MKTFEENLDAWLEGRLQGKELEQFEASLPEISAAELEQQANELKLGTLLKTQIGTPKMSNQEFFSHQISEAIAREEAEDAEPVAAPVRETWWSISRLVWAGATSLAIFLVCTFFIQREEPNAGKSGYLADIVDKARLDPMVSPNATISVFPFDNKEEQRVTVIWIDGLQSLPSEYAAK